MKLINTRCALCNSLEDYEIIYKKNFDDSNFNIDIFSARRMPDRIHYQIVRCKNDGLIRSNPILDEENLHNLYKRSKFTYKEETKNLANSYLVTLRPVLDNLEKNSRILEIGCGNGFLLKRLYDMGYESIFGVEPSTDAVNQADEVIKKRILADTFRADSFKPNSFDLIFFFQTIDHIQDPNKFLQMCYNLLVPGGFILSFNHDVESPQARILRKKSPIVDIEHPYLYSRKTLKKIFEKNNFKILKIYSPFNIISLRYLIWLAPIPNTLKNKILNLKRGIFDLMLKQKIKLKLGNMCLVGTS